jgi:hypothetical protein
MDGDRPVLHAATRSVREEREQVAQMRFGVRAPELEQVLGVAAVEVEVGEEIGLRHDPADGVAQRRVGEPGACARRRAVSLEALGGDDREIAGRQEVEVPDDAVGRPASPR